MAQADEPSKCHLLRLPPELRLLIYDLMLDVQTHIVNIATYSNDVHLRTTPISRQLRAALVLSATCNMIYVEIAPVIYQKAQFTLSIWGLPACGSAMRFASSGSLSFLERTTALRIRVMVAKYAKEDQIDAVIGGVRRLRAAQAVNEMIRVTRVKTLMRSGDWAGYCDAIADSLLDLRYSAAPKFSCQYHNDSISDNAWRELLETHRGKTVRK